MYLQFGQIWSNLGKPHCGWVKGVAGQVVIGRSKEFISVVLSVIQKWITNFWNTCPDWLLSRHVQIHMSTWMFLDMRNFDPA